MAVVAAQGVFGMGRSFRDLDKRLIGIIVRYKVAGWLLSNFYRETFSGIKVA